MGLPTSGPVASFTAAGMTGSLRTFRHVACRAKQARYGASDDVVETVETDDIEDAREDRDRSEMSDSGLEPEEVVLTDGRREPG